MIPTSKRRRQHLAQAAVLCLLAFAAGCEDEEQGPPLTDSTPGDWRQLVAGQATHPAFGPPAGPAAGLIAFSSFRVGASGDSVGTYEHIWVMDLSDSSLHQITRGSQNDLEPAWSPGGTRLAFTRDNGVRRDIFWTDVSDLDAPSAPLRITDISVARAGGNGAGWMLVGSEEQVVFSNGSDILRLPLTGGSPVKLVPDPADVRPSDCGGAGFEDLQPRPAGGRLAFLSRGRASLGSLRVGVTDEVGAAASARVWLQGCGVDSLVQVGSSAFFAKLPAGDYTVRGFRSATGLCDTLSLPVSLVADDTVEVTLSFAPTRGTILARTISSNSSQFNYQIDCEDTDFLATPVLYPEVLDSLIFTPLTCVEAGLHVVTAVQGVGFDTAWVNVPAGGTVSATLVLLDRTLNCNPDNFWGYAPHGGEGDFFTRECPSDPVAMTSDSAFVGGCWECKADSVCLDPPACTTYAPVYNWSAFTSWDDPNQLCPEGREAPRFDTARVTPGRAGSRLQLGEEIWIYDLASDTFSSPLPGVAAQGAVWDPTDPDRLAYLVRVEGYWGVEVLDLSSGARTPVPLPGQTGPFVCRRDALGLSWSADGQNLAVSLGPCSGGQYPQDLAIWTVDLARLGL